MALGAEADGAVEAGDGGLGAGAAARIGRPWSRGAVAGVGHPAVGHRMAVPIDRILGHDAAGEESLVLFERDLNIFHDRPAFERGDRRLGDDDGRGDRTVVAVDVDFHDCRGVLIQGERGQGAFRGAAAFGPDGTVPRRVHGDAGAHLVETEEGVLEAGFDEVIGRFREEAAMRELQRVGRHFQVTHERDADHGGQDQRHDQDGAALGAQWCRAGIHAEMGARAHTSLLRSVNDADAIFSVTAEPPALRRMLSESCRRFVAVSTVVVALSRS